MRDVSTDTEKTRRAGGAGHLKSYRPFPDLKTSVPDSTCGT